MTAKEIIRHMLGAVAAGVAAWIGSRLGVPVDPAWIVTLGIAAYAGVEKGLRRRMREPTPATTEKTAALQAQLDCLGAEVVELRRRLPPLCDVSKAGVFCAEPLNHDGPHSWER